MPSRLTQVITAPVIMVMSGGGIERNFFIVMVALPVDEGSAAGADGVLDDVQPAAGQARMSMRAHDVLDTRCKYADILP